MTIAVSIAAGVGLFVLWVAIGALVTRWPRATMAATAIACVGLIGFGGYQLAEALAFVPTPDGGALGGLEGIGTVIGEAIGITCVAVGGLGLFAVAAYAVSRRRLRAASDPRATRGAGTCARARGGSPGSA